MERREEFRQQMVCPRVHRDNTLVTGWETPALASPGICHVLLLLCAKAKIVTFLPPLWKKLLIPVCGSTVVVAIAFACSREHDDST